MNLADNNKTLPDAKQPEKIRVGMNRADTEPNMFAGLNQGVGSTTNSDAQTKQVQSNNFDLFNMLNQNISQSTNPNVPPA